MKHTHAHNSLLVFAFSVFLVTVALYTYMYIAVNEQTKRVVMAKDIQKVQKMDEEQIKKLQALFSHSEPGRDRLYSLYIAKDDVVSFIESLESIGTMTGADVQITSIQEVKGEDAAKIGSVKAHVSATGSWNQVSKSLVLLETMQKAIVIEGVRLNASSGSGASASSRTAWSLSADITAFILK